MFRTRYVKTPEQVARLQDALAAPAFLDIRSLGVTFESDPDVLAELLPPPLALAGDARVSVSVSEIRRSNCVGPFNGAQVTIPCEFEGEQGNYCVTMPMSTDTAVIFGRELYAEPKKLADISLTVDESGRARGTVTRHGVTYIELRGAFEDRPSVVERPYTAYHYYVKYMPSADGRGFAHDPELVRVTHRGLTRSVTQGNATITFRESPHDPIIDIPVLSVLGATLSEGETYTQAEVVATLNPAAFMPYAFGKMDDLTIWSTAPVREPATLPS